MGTCCSNRTDNFGLDKKKTGGASSDKKMNGKVTAK